MTKDYSSSVKQRLLNMAKERGDEFNLLLVRYALERLLYRLGKSKHGDGFVLKGAMLFSLWSGSSHRATKDLDLLSFWDPDVKRLVAIFKDVCSLSFPEDGLTFIPDTIKGQPIREDAIYDGIRLAISCLLGKARLNLQVDIGFGDALYFQAEQKDYPTLLEMASPRLKVYPREVVIAEKLEAAVSLGMDNSRMKDFYDMWYLSKTFNFNGKQLADTIQATFKRRKTELPKEPICFTEQFYADPSKKIQWKSFLKKTKVESPELALDDAIHDLRDFLLPMLALIAANNEFSLLWNHKEYCWSK